MIESVYEQSTNTTNSDFYFEQYFAEEYKRYSEFTNVVYVLQFAVAVIGIIADITICGILLRKKRLLKNFSNFHLFNLAMTDVVFRLALTPVLFAIENKEVRDGSNALCKLGGFGSYTTLAVTFVLLLGITLDRYFHIVHPIKARNITWKHSRKAVFFSWLYGAACSSPILFSMEYSTVDWKETDYEVCLWGVGLPFQISSSVFLFFAFLLPLALMTVAYAKILKVLWERARNNVCVNSQIANAKFRAVKMMVGVVIAYSISWGPKLVWDFLQAFEIVSLEYMIDWESEEIPLEDKIREEKNYIKLLIIDDTMELLTYTSSVLNSVIFGYYNKSFREELKSCCCRINYSQCDAKTKSRKKTVQPEPQTIFFENETMRSLDVCNLEDISEFSLKVYFPKDTTKMTEDLEVITTKL